MSQRDVFDQKCLKVSTSQWISAFDIAKRFGVSYQAVARAMQRLFVAGKLETMIVKVKTKSRNGGEQRKLYKARVAVTFIHPWLGTPQLPAGTPRLIRGRAGSGDTKCR